MTDCIVTEPETLTRDAGPPCLIRGAHLVEHPPGSPEAEVERLKREAEERELADYDGWGDDA